VINLAPRKPWATVEWRKKREEYIEDKQCEWCGSKNDLVIHHPQKPNSLTDEEYFSFVGTMILCKRCHYALHRGYVLCRKCKNNYHRPIYDMCSKCNKDSIPQEVIWRNEIIEYIHPVCGKIIKGKRGSIEEAFEFGGALELCMHFSPRGCDEDVNNCEEYCEYDRKICEDGRRKKRKVSLAKQK
jgi:hypothetical protein